MGRDQSRASFDCGALGEQITKQLAGLPLLLADGLLDEARRLLWMTTFSGMAMRDAIHQLATPDQSIIIARLGDGFDIMQFDEAIAEARRLLWAVQFATLPDTKFGRVWAAQLEADATDKRH